MSNTDEGKPAGKSGQRSRKGDRGKKTVSKKRPPESPVPVQLQSPDQDQPLQPQPVHAESPKMDEPPVFAEPVAVSASPEPLPVAAAPSPAGPAPAEPVLAAPALPEPVAKPPTAAPAPVTLQTITNAYRDYTRKSFEDFGSFFEQLSGARSLDKAMSVHTEFVKRAYETSVAESQKICELHNRLARQTLQPLQGLVGKARETHGKS